MPTLTKNRNSLVLTIPKELAARVGWKAGDQIYCERSGSDKILMEKQQKG